MLGDETLPLIKSIKVLCIYKDKDPRTPKTNISPWNGYHLQQHPVTARQVQVSSGSKQAASSHRGMAMNDVQLPVTYGVYFSSHRSVTT